MHDRNMYNKLRLPICSKYEKVKILLQVLPEAVTWTCSVLILPKILQNSRGNNLSRNLFFLQVTGHVKAGLQIY